MKKRDRDQLEFALGHRLEFVSIEAEQAARKRIREFEAEAQKPEEPLDHRDPRRILDIYVDGNDEEVTAKVINKLLSVLEPEEKVVGTDSSAADGGNDLKKRLHTLQKRYEVDTELIGRMYQAERVRATYGDQSRSPGRKSEPSTLPHKARSSRAGRRRILPEIDLTKRS